MTSPLSCKNFIPHGSRSEILLLPPRSDDFMTSHPWTAMYLISPPLPRGVSAVQFNITSHDQGWCSDRSQGIWSWFDVSILCSDRDGGEDPSSLFSDLSDHPSSYLKSRPEDFRQVLQDQGLHFKNIPKQDPDPAKPGSIAKRMASNQIQRSWQQHVVIWRVEDGGEEAEFLSCLEEGDQLVVWARTQVGLCLVYNSSSSSSLD
ncbi:hypothetical protein BO79DRAFT_208479 [Aspergillus costaricaensis CBS 115574]|uniref:Uncharacterized protein n=1 Tax=Aspergillus costaricaensis CBS 115574 TaxID=1448317 RepID=A0ACD1II75_9EURO|nr:hypothetical protein BO79DRAFT_208479 [Aspergillus costaricaensis CBS 115574]RAK90269.1 hypothetical protein BO79DRAFT_208479 [Aspergillus costaricaensis CBS 115574]